MGYPTVGAQADGLSIVKLGKSLVGGLWTLSDEGAMGGRAGGFSPGSANGGRRLLTKVDVLHRQGRGVKVLLTTSAQIYFASPA
jgi:hypothetical protein